MKCSVKECEKEVFGKGLCNMHYSRLRRHGDIEAARPDDWGVRKNHELYDAWRELVRKKEKSRAAVWEDFWVFVKDVGTRPTEKHVLGRQDETQPFGPGNFFWREKIFVKENAESVKEYRARYQREYRVLHPERVKKYEMKRYFGLPAGEYEEMLRRQNHVCAICKQPETVMDAGKVRSLAVDHCHAKGSIRALLCTRCNRGLGYFKDNPVYLQAAIQYLEHHNGNEETDDDGPQA
jgi:hypothetical protein